MTPRSRLIAATLIAAVLPAEAQSRPESAKSRGARVAGWLLKLDSADPDVVTEAADSIFEIDPTSDAPIPKLISLLASRDPEMRSSAAFALVPYGPRAREALPALARMLRQDRERPGGRGALLALFAADTKGAVALPAICGFEHSVPAFFDELPRLIRNAGPRSYGAAARRHSECLATLLKAARSSELASTLLNLGIDPKFLVPALRTLFLADPAALPSRAFVRADPVGTFAIPMLAALLEEREVAIRMAALDQITAFGPKAKHVTPLVFTILRAGTELGLDVEAFERSRRALWALAAIGVRPASVVGIADDVRRVPAVARRDLLAPIARLDPDGSVAVPLLCEQLAEASFELRMAAVDALGWIGPGAAPAVPALLIVLSDLATDEARVRVIDALGMIGHGAAAARPVLITQLRDPGSPLAAAARWALAAIGSPLTDAEIADLGAQLPASPDSADAIVAAQRIGLAGEAGKDALPALTGALAARSPRLKIAAAWAIGAIGPAAAAAVPDLMRVLEEEPPGVGEALCDYAIEALGRIGPAARQAAPLLSKRGSRYVVDAALRRIQPPLRNPLTVTIDPQLVLPVSGDADWKPSLPWREPDGSYRIGIGSGGGLSGFYGGVFLSRDRDDRPVATCDLSHFTCVSSGCWGPTAVTAGTLTLRSADLGSGKPIIGILTVTRIEGGGREDLFDPPLTFPFQSADPFAAPTSRPR